MGTNQAPPPDDRANGPQRSGKSLTDRDKALSACDQTLSEHDQTLSDRDQQASDDDQAASDGGSEAGADAAIHARTTAARAETARDREEVGDLRETTAGERDTAAAQRDDLAAGRDEAADLADREAQELRGSDDLADEHLTAQELRAHAAAGRARAADDRRRAARHRELAAQDREQSARDRRLASRDRELAATDELTGARRRGVGLDELQHAIDRARREGTKLTIAYVDVDDLKSLNDSDGHRAGDQLLCDVAEALRRHMRSYDLLVRVGGDEFLCVLPGITVSEARGRFEQMGAELADGGSVSFGLSELCEDDTPQGFIDRADHDLLANRSR